MHLERAGAPAPTWKRRDGLLAFGLAVGLPLGLITLHTYALVHLHPDISKWSWLIPTNRS